MKRFKLLAGLLCAFFMYGCSLDYENTNGITPDGVWKDAKMIDAFLSNIYGNMMPGWPIAANNEWTDRNESVRTWRIFRRY